MRKANSNTKQFFASWLIHALIFWAVNSALQLGAYYLRILENGYYIFYQDGSPLTVARQFYNMNRYDHYWGYALVYTFFAEGLRHWVYRRRHFALFMLLTAVSGVAFELLYYAYSYVRLGNNSGARPFDPDHWALFCLYVISYAAIREFIYQKLYRKDIRLAKAEAGLRSLRAQVNPHFFFNTFNYIYGMALREKAPLTSKAIEMMTAMMRYNMTVIEENFVPLADELTFIRNYIALQQLRITEAENIKIKVNLPDNTGATMIAPLLLIPLVENAFKYGISLENPSFITIGISANSNTIHIQIENSLHHDAGDAGLGTGIKNVTQRLLLLYPKKHKLIIDRSAGSFSVNLTLNE